MTAAPATTPDPPAVFIPSERAVDAVAAALYGHLGGESGEPWSSLGVVAKNAWRQIALPVLVSAGTELVTSALVHVTANHTQYGFGPALRDELIFAQQATSMMDELHDVLAAAAGDGDGEQA